MNHHDFLLTLLVYLGAAVIAVPLFKKFGLASVLGYLAAGSLLGPSGLKLINDVKSTMGFAELGVVLLLFIIGLELKPSRLWVLRKSVFGLGGAQVFITALPLGIVAWLAGQNFLASTIIALSLAFSSTAFALQILSEKKQLATHAGRSAFSILLFQDLAAIPLLALIPLLGVTEAQTSSEANVWLSVGKVVLAMGGMVIVGRYLLRPAFRTIAQAKTSEIFTAATLLLIVAVGLLMETLGLSMALGSFLAGVLLADSEYRHELEADIEPFKGLLLGLFFMTVGMSVDYSLLVDRPLLVLGLVLGILILKMSVNYGLGRVIGKLNDQSARQLAMIIPQGGEFAFVIFAAAVTFKILNPEVTALLVVVVTLSMALTPFLVNLNEKVLDPKLSKNKSAFDKIENEDNQVIIAGFGRFGQIVGRTLRVLGVGFTALEADADQVEVLRKFGSKVYYGDATKHELLKAAGAEKARLFVLAIDNIADSVKTAQLVKKHFPHLKVLARARNRAHVFDLMDSGVDHIWRETFGSSLELTEELLHQLGISEDQSRNFLRQFRDADEKMLLEQHKVHKDQEKLIDVSKRAAEQLIKVLQTDQQNRT